MIEYRYFHPIDEPKKILYYLATFGIEMTKIIGINLDTGYVNGYMWDNVKFLRNDEVVALKLKG